MSYGFGLALLGAALAVGLSGVGSAIGIGYAGQASIGAMTEDPENFGRYLILTALPGTQGIYGFVAAFMLMVKINLLGATPVSLTTTQGWSFFVAGLPIAIAGFASAIHQGKVCTAGVGLTVKRPADSMKAMVLAVFVEFYAVLGLLISIFLINGIKV
ncbi:MAG: V-type ATP synthase subunit K [Candidatus Aerophobetes bacterium]|nr:V-type ATP synthase subunit K [Candidatus Aerophobetes bacterium]